MAATDVDVELNDEVQNKEPIVYLKLISNDNVEFVVDQKVSFESLTISKMIKDCEDDDKTLYLPKVDSHFLKLVLTFSEEYVKNPFYEIEKPLTNEEFTEITSEWYFNFLQYENLVKDKSVKNEPYEKDYKIDENRTIKLKYLPYIDILYELLKTADYLENTHLMELIGGFYAYKMRTDKEFNDIFDNIVWQTTTLEREKFEKEEAEEKAKEEANKNNSKMEIEDKNEDDDEEDDE